MKTGSNGLSYPFDNRPNPGELIEVGPGIFWVRMPLPISLNHINLWMLEEQDGWTLVDTGMATEDTKALWEEIFSTHLNSKPVKQVIVTHMHFDHLGLAGWLVEKWGATLCMSRTEYLSSRVIINEIKSDPPEATVAFFRAAGVEESILDEFKVRFNNRSDFVSPLPSHYKRLTDNQVLQIGSLQWTVIIVEGHSPEHICLHCKSLNIMIAGDQILPRISPNISVRPDEPRANPLHNFLRSCESLKNRLNKDVLILPSHGDPFYGVHLRLQDMINEHKKGLQDLLEFCSQPRSVAEVFPILFKSKINIGNMVIAVGEAVANLNYLVSSKELVVDIGSDGIARYKQA
ncbi:MAG: MBL fold metallo-hydrolase [Rhodobacteraceae bacterium]|nr:MBL fold metallo-hydrolase [Paracoccaceae bacterium]MDG1243146.1 MBL fold metallo-hydrolase [Porticoccaceae bacterium]MDG1323315.1 MBL fold metallo-hydrolase [Porticoccaceae bacterium]|tara:strand:+ start:4353 stop:5390 length:1038 start_codon:yes stop_codon:yes gene_type:complete